METVKKDFKKAATLYRSTCDDYNFSHSCHKYATYSLIGKGSPPDYPKAFEYFQKGCHLDDASSCFFAGLMCIFDNKNTKIKQDYPQGMGFLNKSCEKGSGNSCHYLSGMYFLGVPDVLEKNLTSAYEYSHKACDLGNIYACANLSRMYIQGDGVERDPELASKYKKKVIVMEKELKGQFQRMAVK
jgi:cytochrome c oxidase assembly factor 7